MNSYKCEKDSELVAGGQGDCCKDSLRRRVRTGAVHELELGCRLCVSALQGPILSTVCVRVFENRHT